MARTTSTLALAFATGLVLASWSHAEPPALSAPEPPAHTPAGESETPPIETGGGATDGGDRPLIAPDDPVVLEAVGGTATSDPLGLGEDRRPGSGEALIAEGTYLSRWTGRLVEPAPGLWVFAFDGDTTESRGPVMVMLPCLRLLEMQRLMRDRGGDLPFRVSGHVTMFEGRNYFLPRVVTTITQTRPIEAANGGASAGRGGSAEDPSVEALMERVRAAAPAAEVALRTSPDELGEERRLMKEGSMVMSRVGRAVRRSEGAIEFVVDNGVLGDGANDATAILLPSLLTAEIARLVDERGDRVRFVLSGEILVYAGRTYVLPTLYRVEVSRAVGGLTPAQ